MKLKDKINLILEEYVDNQYDIFHKTYFSIFKNPDKSEIRDVISENDGLNHLRFIADYKNKNLYIFCSDLPHFDAIKKLPISSKAYEYDDENLNYYFGIGKLQGGKIKCDSFDIFKDEERNIEEFYNKQKDNENWLKPWFVLTPIKFLEKKGFKTDHEI